MGLDYDQTESLLRRLEPIAEPYNLYIVHKPELMGGFAIRLLYTDTKTFQQYVVEAFIAKEVLHTGGFSESLEETVIQMRQELNRGIKEELSKTLLDPVLAMEEFKKAMEGTEMTTRKRITMPKATREAPVSKTSRPIKKPTCAYAGHGEMRFNPVRNMFECTSRGCRFVVKPKESSESSQIKMGTGNIDLRVVYMDDSSVSQPRILLVSDNNVALDVTDYLEKGSVQKFVETYGVLTGAKRARELKKPIVRKSTRCTLPLVTDSFSIMGAEFAPDPKE